MTFSFTLARFSHCHKNNSFHSSAGGGCLWGYWFRRNHSIVHPSVVMDDMDIHFFQCEVRSLLVIFQNINGQTSTSPVGEEKKKAPAAECNAPLTQLWNAARTGSRVGKNVSVVDLSIPKVKRSMYVNKENLKHIFLCSNDSLQTAWLRLLQTTQELFTPEQFQWIKCMNSYDEQLLANFSTIFSQGLIIKPHFCF